MKKTEVLQVRVSPAEKEMLQALADKEHLTIAEMVRYLIRKDWSLEEALRILTLETLEDLDAAGLSWESLWQLAQDVSHDAVGIWEEEDKDPRQSGLIFNVNGKEITVTTDYSGVAGRYWQSQDNGTFWMA